MADNTFFEESREQSKVKTTIVAKYFDRWARIMMATQDQNPQKWGRTIAYVDLFAGPGRFEDGTQSTPLVLIEKAITDEKLRERLAMLFNDKDANNSKTLEVSIQAINGINSLKHAPVVMNREVGTEMVKLFDSYNLVPTLFFVDPWGYKGLSLQLINTVVKDWGCDCIFFFNYNRINMGLPNLAVDAHMNALFGETRAEKLRSKLQGLPPQERESAIIEEICQAIKEMGNGKRYVLPFAFRNESGNRTKHHLIFVSKGFKGYEQMKEVMFQESSSHTDGVASFEYNPATQRQPLLFSLSRPVADLEEALLSDFASQKLTMQRIYELHNEDRPYIKKNYKQALINLYDKKLILAPTKRKGSFGDGVEVTFPKK